MREPQRLLSLWQAEGELGREKQKGSTRFSGVNKMLAVEGGVQEFRREVPGGSSGAQAGACCRPGARAFMKEQGPP